MLSIFVIAYLIICIISLRYKNKREAQMEKPHIVDVSVISPVNDSMPYTNCNDWENVIYYNEMIYCKLHLHDHIIQQVVQ